MPEIGETLREARMRRRIDMTEVETATKIRGKYLRALENEEWDLLPGPTFVKSFLRTYAEYLGLDSRLLVEEYRQRYERPSTQDLTPFSAARRADRRAGGRRRLAAIGPVLVIGGSASCCCWRRCRCSARGGGDDETPAAPIRPAAHGDADAGGGDDGRRSGHESGARAPPRGCGLQLVATGPVYVCLVDARGQQVIDEETLAPGTVTPHVQEPRFRTNFGNDNMRMRVNGRTYRWRRAPTRSATSCGRAKPPRRLSDAAAAGLLVVSVRAGIVVTGTEVLSGIIRDENGPWLAERLRSSGVTLAHVMVVGDRPDDLRAALRVPRAEGWTS